MVQDLVTVCAGEVPTDRRDNRSRSPASGFLRNAVELAVRLAQTEPLATFPECRNRQRFDSSMFSGFRLRCRN